MLGLSRPIRDRRLSGWSSGGLWRADGRDVVIDGMLRRTAGKSVCLLANCWEICLFAGELVVAEPLDAVRRLPF